MKRIREIKIENFQCRSGYRFPGIILTYEVFGIEQLEPNNVILVNHALTGNSEVTGEGGWWQQIIGHGKLINTDFKTVIAFNFPGNGFAPTNGL